MARLTLNPYLLLATISALLIANAVGQENHAKVLILGAGSAGIQAAATLHENGEDDFIVIEGADYIGGRVKNANFSGYNVNVGAQWASPGGGSEFVDMMIRDWMIEGHEIDVTSLVFRNTSGHEIPAAETDPIWGRIGAAIGRAAEIGQDILDNDKQDVSQRAALLDGGWFPKTALEKVIEWLSFDFATSERTSVTSLLSTIFSDYENDIHYITDPRGFAAIFDFIAPFIFQDEAFADHVRLNQVVTTVDYSNEDMVVVTCSDGTVYTADYAIVTFSLGVFQNEVIEYIPPLPNWKKWILSQFSVTYYTAIFLNFPERFWDNVETIMNVDERYNYYPAFFNFDVFDNAPEDAHILTTHILGDEALRVDQQSEEDTKTEIEVVLQKMYGLDEQPNATDFLIHSWLKDPLQLAGYCNWPVEVSRYDFPKLQERVGKIFFAGDSTDDVATGFVYGALRSGRREAMKVLECMNGGECPQYEPSIEEEKACECSERPKSGKTRKDCSVATCVMRP